MQPRWSLHQTKHRYTSSTPSCVDAATRHTSSRPWGRTDGQDEVVSQVLLADQPSKQFVGTDEVGAFVAFLCSDAARSVTGSTLSIDGGWTAR